MVAERCANTRNASRTTQKKSRSCSCCFSSSVWVLFTLLSFSRVTVRLRARNIPCRWDLKGILLVVFFWGVWHGFMQTYGFCRIYDAKTGTFDALTRRLDFAMCVIWFATAVALSPYRLSDTLDMYYMSGGPFIPPQL